MALTLEHDRKMARAKQNAENKALKEREIDEVIAKAVKRYVGNGTKGRGGQVMLAKSPDAQIDALDQYISDLKEIKEEIDLRYGPGIERRLWLIDLEINKAIEAIASLRMEQVAPGE